MSLALGIVRDSVQLKGLPRSVSSLSTSHLPTVYLCFANPRRKGTDNEVCKFASKGRPRAERLVLGEETQGPTITHHLGHALDLGSCSRLSHKALDPSNRPRHEALTTLCPELGLHWNVALGLPDIRSRKRSDNASPPRNVEVTDLESSTGVLRKRWAGSKSDSEREDPAKCMQRFKLIQFRETTVFRYTYDAAPRANQSSRRSLNE